MQQQPVSTSSTDTAPAVRSEYAAITSDPTLDPGAKADLIISKMVKLTAAAAAVPVYVNWALYVVILSAGVVAIGFTYDVHLKEDQAWKLIKQFFIAAGANYAALFVGSKIISGVLTITGAGYFAAAALDAVVFCPATYAIGKSAKAYFEGERRNEQIGRAFRAHVENFKKLEGK